MELHKFLKEFTQDFKEKARNYLEKNKVTKRTGYKHSWFFALEIFPEAIENFAKAQREECLKNFLTGDIPLKTAILDAPMPELKIEES